MVKVGLDVGKRNISVFIRHENGKTQKVTIKADVRAVTRLANEVLPEKSVCAIEASVSTWTIVRILLAFGHEVKVVNPVDAKSISASVKKTDDMDAKMLCSLLSLPELKTVWIPDEKTEKLRTLATHMKRIVKMRTMYKNEIRSILQRNLIECEHCDITKGNGLQWLNECAKNLKEEEKFIVEWNVKQVRALKEREKEIIMEMARACGEDEMVKKALQVEGIGIKGALLMRARIGTMSRFSTAKEVGAYCGVVPRVQLSGEYEGSNRITKRGNGYLRGVLTEGMRAALVKDGKIRSFYLQQVANNGGNGNKAIMACANKALRIVWTLCTKKEDYNSVDRALYSSKLKTYKALAGIKDVKEKDGVAA